MYVIGNMLICKLFIIKVAVFLALLFKKYEKN